MKLALLFVTLVFSSLYGIISFTSTIVLLFIVSFAPSILSINYSVLNLIILGDIVGFVTIVFVTNYEN